MDDNDRDVDPEVLADLQLRAASERDTTRSRPGPNETWRPSPTATTWPCRGRCGAVVEISAEAVEAMRVFNAQLASTMDAPIDVTRCVFCAACRKYGTSLAADRNLNAVKRMSELVRELRGGTTSPEAPGPAPNPVRERELLEHIRKLGHPDTTGLVRALSESRTRHSGKPHRRVGM